MFWEKKKKLIQESVRDKFNFDDIQIKKKPLRQEPTQAQNKKQISSHFLNKDKISRKDNFERIKNDIFKSKMKPEEKLQEKLIKKQIDSSNNNEKYSQQRLMFSSINGNMKSNEKETNPKGQLSQQSENTAKQIIKEKLFQKNIIQNVIQDSIPTKKINIVYPDSQPLQQQNKQQQQQQSQNQQLHQHQQLQNQHQQQQQQLHQQQNPQNQQQQTQYQQQQKILQPQQQQIQKQQLQQQQPQQHQQQKQLQAPLPLPQQQQQQQQQLQQQQQQQQQQLQQQQKKLQPNQQQEQEGIQKQVITQSSDILNKQNNQSNHQKEIKQQLNIITKKQKTSQNETNDQEGQKKESQKEVIVIEPKEQVRKYPQSCIVIEKQRHSSQQEAITIDDNIDLEKEIRIVDRFNDLTSKRLDFKEIDQETFVNNQKELILKSIEDSELIRIQNFNKFQDLIEYFRYGKLKPYLSSLAFHKIICLNLRNGIFTHSDKQGIQLTTLNYSEQLLTIRHNPKVNIKVVGLLNVFHRNEEDPRIKSKYLRNLQ